MCTLQNCYHHQLLKDGALLVPRCIPRAQHGYRVGGGRQESQRAYRQGYVSWDNGRGHIHRGAQKVRATLVYRGLCRVHGCSVAQGGGRLWMGLGWQI